MKMTRLSAKKCTACEDKKLPAMKMIKAKELLLEIPKWKMGKNPNHLTRVWLFSDFKKALTFVNHVGKIAEREGHHPDILVNYNKVILIVYTHSMGGLSENDFILAAKIDKLDI